MNKCKWCGRPYNRVFFEDYCCKKCESEAKATGNSGGESNGKTGCLSLVGGIVVIVIIVALIGNNNKSSSNKNSSTKSTSTQQVDNTKTNNNEYSVKNTDNNKKPIETSKQADNSINTENAENIEDNDDIIVGNICYRNYSNSKFKFSIPYPKDFTVEESTDGGIFSGKNAELRVYGSLASSDIKELFESSKEERNNQVSYEHLGDNWFVLSGSSESGKIYYQKTVHNDNGMDITAILTYEESEKQYYERMIKYIFNNIKNIN